MRPLAIAILILFSFHGGAATVASVSNSEKYQTLILDNEVRMRFTDGQNQKLNRYFHSSPNYQMAEQTLESLYSGPTVRTTIKCGDTREIQWIDDGLGKTSEVNLVDLTGSTPTVPLYSSFQQGIGNAAAITGLLLSPKSDYLVIIVSKFGSIDQMQGIVLDVKTHREIARLGLYENDLAWVSPTKLNYTRLEDNGASGQAIFDAATGTDAAGAAIVVAQSPDLVLLADRSHADAPRVLLASKQYGTNAEITLSGTAKGILDDEASLLGSDDTHAYFVVRTDNDSQIFSVDWSSLKSSQKPLAPVPLITETKLFFEQGWVANEGLFVQARMGGERVLRVYSPSGQKLAEVEVPNCCSITGVSWAEPNNSVSVTVTSPIVAKGIFVYDLRTKKWNKDPEAAMLTADGALFKTEIFNSVSADGTVVPARLTRRADSNKNGSRPVLIKSYGGFQSPGYFDPRFDRAILEFLKRGGVFVGPALRGGNEFGLAWHKQAMLVDKIKTFQDLDAVARQLVSDFWTTPRKVAIQGTSNGGLTTAATALLFPNDFGLAIPIAGVDDLLGKDELDSINQGWSYEYGTVQDNSSYLRKYSPLENAGNQGQIRFLIIDGVDDTRVNPAHSVKLAKALIDQGGSPDNTFLFTVASAGHGTQSVVVNNSIGLSVQIAIWTMIYDMAD